MLTWAETDQTCARCGLSLSVCDCPAVGLCCIEKACAHTCTEADPCSSCAGRGDCGEGLDGCCALCGADGRHYDDCPLVEGLP